MLYLHWKPDWVKKGSKEKTYPFPGYVWDIHCQRLFRALAY